MEKKKKERRVIIIDFEVLSEARFWMCCLKDAKTGMEYSIINNKEELERVYKKNFDTIWVGYNIKGYDQWIFKSIIAGEDPFTLSTAIVRDRKNPWEINPKLNKIKLNFFEIGSRQRSLKELELFMGESIEESSVPFDIKTYPTKKQIEELTSYCKHDVNMTYKVFLELKYEFDSRAFLIDYFNLNDSLFKKTKAQFSAYLLEAKKPDIPRNDEFQFKIIDNIVLNKYSYIMYWYKSPENMSYDKSLSTTVYGCIVEFGWGGLHSAKKKYIGEGCIVNSDVKSYHPSNMIENKFLSRNISNPDKYIDIRDTRLKFKADKNPWEKSFKDVLNITYGALKDANNELYDPQMSNAVCVNGQLMLLDLIEKIEERFGDKAEFIQGNTDGVMFKLSDKNDIDDYLKICDEWSKRTKMELDHDFIKKVVQKDVNNYVIVMSDGKIKSKGAYVKKLSLLDNDLPIVNKSILNNILTGKSIRETILESTSLVDFQKCIKVSDKYKCAIHNGKQLNLKILRAFASTDFNDTSITKLRDSVQNKIGNTPERAFILNENIINMPIPSKLDREWYIALAEKRLNDFIPNNAYEYSLFDLLCS